ncbi:MAG: serine/threonine protein kinase, bacterial [Thermoleophilaceae bacterium]|nr:serine/threonine protein kinase, bacterial [Thermoleophilaceae bacterium]
MATVWLAQDERLGRPVAVKRLHADVSDEDLVRRFQREARLGASLNHPNVVAVYDIALDDEGVLIVMEYVDGRTLRDEVSDGPVPPERALGILRGVAAALDHAHDLGVLHRDVKPANVLLRNDGTAKLADLGIATAAEQSRITRSGSVLGTAAYMAPERLEGRPGDRAADVYALAAVAFELLSGRKAVEGTTPLEVAHRVVHGPPPDLVEALPQAPRAAADVLRRGLARDPAERPATAGTLVADLAGAYAAAPPAAAHATAPPTAPTAAMKGGPSDAVLPRGRIATSNQDGDPDRRRKLLVIAAVCALLVAALVIALASGGDDSGKPRANKPAPARKHTKSKPAAPATSQPSATPAASPAATVNDFYQRAARHDYQGAWSLATSRAQRQLGGFDSFSGSQSTLRSISFPVLRTVSQASDSATVQLQSNAVHVDRTDHVCGTVGLVRSGSRWLLDSFQLDTCPTSSAPAAGSAQPGKHRGKKPKAPKPSKARGDPGAQGGD